MNIDYNQTSINYFLKIEDELDSKYRIEFELNEWDIENWAVYGEKIGEKATKNPELPTDNKEALQLVKDYYATKDFLIQIVIFLETFYSWNSEAMEEKLSEINLFIKNTKSITMRKSFEPNIHISGDLESQKIIYRRLVNNYYDNNPIPFLEVGIIKVVYGKYFLFKELLEKKLKELSTIEKPQLIPRLQTNLDPKQRAKLFTELVNGGFIPDENEDCFNWAIGVTDEKEPIQPGQWQPIKWRKAKNLAVYLIDKLCFNDQLRIQENYFSIGSIIFNIHNMSQIKKGYENNNIAKPINHILIDNILSEIIEAK